MAATSLVLGIVSLFTCSLFFIGAVLGIVLGVSALVKSSSRPQEYGGKGMAVTGIILSGFSFLISITAAVAIPNLVRSRQAAHEAAAINDLRTIARAEAVHFLEKKRYASLEDLEKAGMVNAALTQGVKSGYRFQLRLKSNSFEAVAVPESSGTFGTGTRSFYVSTDSVIRQSIGGREATAADPPVDSLPARRK